MLTLMLLRLLATRHYTLLDFHIIPYRLMRRYLKVDALRATLIRCLRALPLFYVADKRYAASANR